MIIAVAIAVVALMGGGAHLGFALTPGATLNVGCDGEARLLRVP